MMNRRLLLVLFVLLIIGLSAGTAAAQNSQSLWFVNYWNNPNLEGKPAASATAGVIDNEWSGSPGGGVSSNHWSAQWTSYVDFSPGTWRITTQNDDGVRVFLGNKHIIVDWNVHAEVTNQVTVSLLGGTYSMAVDHFNDVGRAVLRVGWEWIGPPVYGAADVTVVPSYPAPPTPVPPIAPYPPPTQTSWLANYWNNTDLAGSPAVVRSEFAVNYDWGYGSPAPYLVGNDLFSARWSRSAYFATGTYRFTAQSDDGIRVYVNGQRIIDNWTVHSVQTNVAEIDLAAGTYPVVVEYFENTGLAVAKVWWEQISGGSAPPPPPAPGGVTATPVTSWLNLRGGPGLNYPILTAVPRGTMVPVIGRTATSRWIQVSYLGTTGWLSTPYTFIVGDLSTVPVTG